MVNKIVIIDNYIIEIYIYMEYEWICMEWIYEFRVSRNPVVAGMASPHVTC